MAANAFINKAEPPSEGELTAALGSAKPVWDRFLVVLDQEFGANVHEWRCYSPKAGWALRVKRKSRTIVWLGPTAGCFNVGFILGDKAMQAARQARLPQQVVKIMNDASKHPEGTGVWLEARASRDIPMLKKLTLIKLAS